jgi:alpha-tubulin suppressor-like RCC1 family protein
MKTRNIFLTVLLLLSFSSTFGQCISTIATGDYFTYGLKPNGTLWNWGNNGAGQLGDGTLFDILIPTPLSSTSSWQKVECGNYNIFAISTTGTLWGAGYNVYGNLGINSTVTIRVLTQIGSASNWKQISASSGFTIGLKTDNTLWGWGQNESYQMGDGTCCSDRLVPGQIGTASDWRFIGAAQGVASVLAIKQNGTLWGWGSNNGGGGLLMGESDLSSRAFPTQLDMATDWATISLGAAHVLALKTDGTLWSWGTGQYGQTADDLSPLYFRNSPRQIGTATWRMAVAGFFSSYGIKSDGTLWAWGRNQAGQLGDGTTIERRMPVQIGSDTDWIAVAGGSTYGLALKANGSLWAWGNNNYGQLGTGDTTASLVPVYVAVAGCTLGTSEFEQMEVVVSPNPARDVLEVSNTTASSYCIYNLLGQLLEEGSITTPVIDVKNLIKGSYVLELVDEDGKRSSVQFVKE